MRLRTDIEDGERFEDALHALLRIEPFVAYANFQPIARRESALLSLHRARWLAATRGLGVLVARDEEDRPLAALALEHQEFESAHFGMRMARAAAPIAVPDEATRLAALGELYGGARAVLRERGYDHLAAVAATQDRIACWAAQQCGAFHVGTKISWMQPLTGRRSGAGLEPGLRFEVHEHPTAQSIDPDRWRDLRAWCDRGFDRGPYVFDMAVPHARATALYRVWTDKAMSGEWADALVLVCDGERVVAFHSMNLLPDLSEAAEVGIVGRGIGATLPGYRGLFTALQRECAFLRPLGAAFLENETQSSTIQTINVFGKLGHQCLRSIASFHMRLRGEDTVRSTVPA